jgi:hypothetical protein
MTDALLAIGLAGDDRLDAMISEVGAERVGVVPLIRQKFSDAGDQADAGLRHDTVGHVARCEDQHPGAAQRIDDRMNLAVAAAFGDAYRLCLRPPFPPLAQRWIFTWLLSSATWPGASDVAATAANICCQMPLTLQRAKRL